MFRSQSSATTGHIEEEMGNSLGGIEDKMGRHRGQYVDGVITDRRRWSEIATYLEHQTLGQETSYG